jgi:hypothetical protein
MPWKASFFTFLTAWSRVLVENPEMPCLLWDLKVHYYHDHKACLWYLSWVKWIVCTLPPDFPKIHFNIILPSMPMSIKWFFPSGLMAKTLHSFLFHHFNFYFRPLVTLFTDITYKLQSYTVSHMHCICNFSSASQQRTNWHAYRSHSYFWTETFERNAQPMNPWMLHKKWPHTFTVYKISLPIYRHAHMPVNAYMYTHKHTIHISNNGATYVQIT